MHESHMVACDPGRRYTIVPNFLGPALPRRDKGDRNYYCMTMLTLFKPWRTGVDLKALDESWDEAFAGHNFSPREHQLMNNFNVRYECYDARDDFGATFRSDKDQSHSNEAIEDYREGLDCDDGWNPSDENSEDVQFFCGPAYKEMIKANRETDSILRLAGRKQPQRSPNQDGLAALQLPRVAIDRTLDSTDWRRIVKAEKDRLWKVRSSIMASNPAQQLQSSSKDGASLVQNDAFVVPGSYLSKDFKPGNPYWSTIMSEVEQEFKLNDNQKKGISYCG
ncbi:hypothetical protein H1R20_g3132, partial [Candolleomyces eurysporus]